MVGSSSEIEKLFQFKIFDTAKLTSILKRIIQFSSKDCIVLDFFSGSATTAHAVMQLNAEDGGKRKFIMVQLPEKQMKRVRLLRLVIKISVKLARNVFVVLVRK